QFRKALTTTNHAGNFRPQSPVNAVSTPYAALVSPVLQGKKRPCSEDCGKEFQFASLFKAHSYGHTGEKPCECPIDGCEAKLSVKSHLNRHIKQNKAHRKEGATTEHYSRRSAMARTTGQVE
ncbi:hypothetical protein RUND412_010811, partial [Rhizina undulata]